MKRCLLIILSIFAAAGLTSCQNSHQTSSDITEMSTNEITGCDPNEYDLPNLDFEGKTIRIFVGDVHNKTTFPSYTVEMSTGDIVDDAVYERNLCVSERLNVNLEWDHIDFEYGTRANYVGHIQSTILSGDGSMDIICGPGYYTTNLIIEDYFIDLNTVKHLNFNKPYWTKMYNQNAEINNKIYSALGDLSLNKLHLSYVMYFNKNMFDAANLEYPYNDVLNGNWTFEQLQEVIKGTYRDLNSDGIHDENDVYGYVSECQNMNWAFMDPCGVKVFDKDNSGNINFTMDNEHNAQVVERVARFICENSDVWYKNITDSSIIAFSEQRAYISPGNLISTSFMRDYDFEYGILPYPKYSENDSNYTTRISSAVSIFLIPVTCSDTEMAGAVLETLNSESLKTTIPAYYETALKIKYTRDEESVMVLDIVRNSITTQFCDMFSTVFSGYSEIFRKSVSDNTGTWVSEVAEIKEAAIEKLNTLLDYYNN